MSAWTRLKSFCQTSWFRLFFGAAVLLPALVYQTILPIVPEDQWSRASEAIYTLLLRFDDAKPGTSQVAIIEVDDETISTYGWPMDRTVYTRALEELKKQGHPWILSLFQFQALGKPGSPSGLKDSLLADAIASYGRYVGTGLEIDKTAVNALSIDQEEAYAPRLLLSASGEVLDEAPSFLRLREDDTFLRGQAAFGPAVALGTEPVIHCGQIYHTDARHTGALVLPSALVWAAAYAGKAGFQASSGGARWPRAVDRPGFVPTRVMNLAYRQCMSSPAVLTEDFLAARRITRISFFDFLENPKTIDLKGKVVILAKEDMRKYRGPGVAWDGDDGVVPEHLLTARLLDDLLSGRAIRRDPLWREANLSWLPLLAAGLLSLASLFLSTSGVLVAGVVMLAGMLAYAWWNLTQGIFLIPTQALASVATTSAALTILQAFLKYYGIRRQVAIARRANEAFSQCNTLGEIEARAFTLCRGMFKDANLTVVCSDRELYDASSDPQAAVALLSRRSQSPTEGQFAPELHGDTRLTRSRRPIGLARMPFRARGMNVQLAIDTKVGRLGTVLIGVAYQPHEEDFVADMLEAFRRELCQHWQRIKILVDQKLLDYKFLMEQTRGDIMKRFLTRSLVARFSDARTMEENLRLVLTPRPTKAALMQADIRGYSKLSARLKEQDMVRILQGYFRTVVDAATEVAQVKLIGDCIFLFIEEDASGDDRTPVDLAVELAAILVRETIAQNRIREEEGIESLNFGIAVHYGDVVVGNLSSETCIDYTVIGPNVNLVARLEELTKNKLISDRLGANGMILSLDAAASLNRYRSLAASRISLSELGVAVRSFTHISDLEGVTAESLLTLTGSSRDSAPAAA